MQITERIVMAYEGELHEFPVSGNQTLITHTAVPANTIYLIDPETAATMVYDLPELLTGRYSGKVTMEVIGYQDVGAGVEQPKGIYRIMENTAWT